MKTEIKLQSSDRFKAAIARYPAHSLFSFMKTTQEVSNNILRLTASLDVGEDQVIPELLTIKIELSHEELVKLAVVAHKQHDDIEAAFHG